MASLFRVFPYASKTGVREPGGALYVPPQGGGRLDNPAIYSVLYLSDHAAGAVAEAFGRFPEWMTALMRGSPSIPGSVRALARYHLPEQERVCNLDDPGQLIALALRPSDVVSRDYARTRNWARQIFEQRTWIGVRWWSYYNPAWSSFGLWDIRKLRLEDVSPLSLDQPAVIEAAKTIVRRIATPARH